MTSVHTKKAWYPPQDWFKHGEIFTNFESRTFIVCSTCLAHSLDFNDCYVAEDATSFWKHIENMHLSDPATMKSIEKQTKSLNECKDKRKIETIVIDDDDEKLMNGKTKDQKPSEIQIPSSSNSEIDEVEENLSILFGEAERKQKQNEPIPLLNNSNNNSRKLPSAREKENTELSYNGIPTPAASPNDVPLQSSDIFETTPRSPVTLNEQLGNKSSVSMSPNVRQSISAGAEQQIRHLINLNPVLTAKGDLGISISFTPPTKDSVSSNHNPSDFQRMDFGKEIPHPTSSQNMNLSHQIQSPPSYQGMASSIQQTYQGTNFSKSNRDQPEFQSADFLTPFQNLSIAPTRNFFNKNVYPLNGATANQVSNKNQQCASTQFENLSEQAHIRTYSDYRVNKSLQRQAVEHNLHSQVSLQHAEYRHNIQNTPNISDSRTYQQHNTNYPMSSTMLSNNQNFSHLTNHYPNDSRSQSNENQRYACEPSQRSDLRLTFRRYPEIIETAKALPIKKRRQSYSARPIKCSYCDRRFNSQQSKAYHIMRYHDPQYKDKILFCCIYCHNTCDIKDFMKHMKKHQKNEQQLK